MEMEILNPEQQAEARRYHGAELRYMVADRLLDLIYLGVVTFALTAAWDKWLTQSVGIGNDYLRAAGMILLVTIGHIIVSFPLSFFSDYRLEKKYGLSTLTAGRWFRRYALRMTLVIGLNLIVLLALFGLIRFCGGFWWLAAAGVFFVFSAILGAFVPVVIVPLFYKTERMEDETLLQRLCRLTEGTTLTLDGVYRLELSAETTKANAMMAGLGATRRVLLGDTLLEHFTPEEIEAVFAHEVGHYVHRHLWKLLVGAFFGSLGMFWLLDFLLQLWLGTPIHYAEISPSVIPFFLFAPMVLGWLTEPIQNGVCRHFERQSDDYAVRVTQNPEAMRSAFVKLAIQNKADPEPHWFEVFWLHSHPSLTERIRRIQMSPQKQT